MALLSCAQVRDQLFKSDAFKRLIACFTTLSMVGQRGEVRRFRPGLDYTVAHYGIITKDPRLDVVLCFVDSGVDGPQPVRGPTAWDDGEVTRKTTQCMDANKHRYMRV